MIVQVKKSDIHAKDDTRNLVLDVGVTPADENQHKLLDLILKGAFTVKNTSVGDHLSFELVASAKVPVPKAVIQKPVVAPIAKPVTALPSDKPSRGVTVVQNPGHPAVLVPPVPPVTVAQEKAAQDKARVDSTVTVDRGGVSGATTHPTGSVSGVTQTQTGSGGVNKESLQPDNTVTKVK